MVVLVTGFKPNGEELNASELLVNSLKANPPQELTKYINLLRFEIFPSNTLTLEGNCERILKIHNPRVCILTGQAPSRNKITIERIATNLKDFKSPDQAGNSPKGEKIKLDTPAAYWSTLPNIEALVLSLEKKSIPAAISNDCGNHLCNQAFYHILHFAKSRNSTMKAGFVHIPILPEQVIKHWSKSPFMPIEMTRDALSTILKQSCLELQ